MSEGLRGKFRRLWELRLEKEKDAAKADESKAAFDTYKEALWEEVAELGVDGALTLDLGAPYGTIQFVPNQTILGHVIDGDLFLDWANSQARTEEFQRPDWRKKVINDEVRASLEAGQELPPGLAMAATRYFTMTRKTPKNK